MNKFLQPKGGAETYTLELGAELEKRGHPVQYFGMYDIHNTVGNRWGLYTKPVDFHHIGLDEITYPFRIIWSQDAYNKMSKLIDNFNPDIIHINNFNYQLTPSIIDAAHDKHVPVILTVHDSQLVCPNHLLYNFKKNTICTKCVKDGNPSHCFETGCIHGSHIKSLIGTLEAERYKKADTYNYIDKFIIPSEFIKEIIETDKRFIGKTVYLQNYAKKVVAIPEKIERKNYIFYFGRLSPEKGAMNIVEAAKAMPEETFICAGTGPSDKDMQNIPNLELVGFKKGKDLSKLIAEAKLVILPSTCYENCPLAVIEAQQYGAAVIAPGYGGASELIDENWQIKDTSPEALINAIRFALDNNHLDEMRKDSIERSKHYLSLEKYTDEILKIYEEIRGNRDVRD